MLVTLVTFLGHRNTAAEPAENQIKDDQVDPTEPQSSFQVMPVTFGQAGHVLADRLNNSSMHGCHQSRYMGQQQDPTARPSVCLGPAST